METYTFSRALHMMRYGGKKIKLNDDTLSIYSVIDDTLYWRINIDWIEVKSMESKEIMGSWVEVKE